MAIDGSRFVFGINPVLEALRARADEVERVYLAQGELARGRAAEIVARAKELHLRIQKLPREQLSAFSKGKPHQGVVAEVRSFAYADFSELLESGRAAGRKGLLVLLDGIQDPQNLGAIVRSAHALGAQGIVLPKDRAAPVTGAVSKASAGAIEHSRIARVVNLSRALEELKDAGFWTAAADATGNQVPWQADLAGPLAVVIGSEGPGVRPGVLKHCDFRLRIPLEGQVASLNASVAAGVLLYEVARQRSAAPVGRSRVSDGSVTT